MTSFELLNKDDYAVLFEGFETAFLQEPFKHPSKSLMHYLPKGFRQDKLKRHQMIRVFTDAILGGELSIRKFVGKEIDSQFERAGINEYINAHKEEPDFLFGVGLSTLAIMLWKNQLRIPGYLVFLLNGIPCPEQCKVASIALHNSFFEALEQFGTIRFEEGSAAGERKSAAALDVEKRRAAKLEKAKAALATQMEKEAAHTKTIEKERDVALSYGEATTKKLKESIEAQEKQEKKLSQLSNEINRLEDCLIKQKENTD